MWDMFSLHPIRASHSWQMPWLLQTLDPPQLLLTQAVIPTLHLCVTFSLPRRTVLCLSLPNCTSLISDCGQWHADEFKFWNAHKPLCLVTCRMCLRWKGWRPGQPHGLLLGLLRLMPGRWHLFLEHGPVDCRHCLHSGCLLCCGSGRDARDAASPAIGRSSWGQPGQEKAEERERTGSKRIASVNYLSLLLLPIKRSV